MENTSTPPISTVVYGIPNCDTVKKARAWLEEHNVPYLFHDFKKLGVPLDHARDWLKRAGWEKLINRRGPTWRKLDAAVQAGVKDDASALAVLQHNSSVIKRPVVRWPDGEVTVGFDEAIWQSRLGAG